MNLFWKIVVAILDVILKPHPTPEPNNDVERLLFLHNQQRDVPLVLNDKLCVAAQKHSEWMYANKKMTHDENGVPFTARLKAAGYSYSRAAENIASGYKTPESVVNGWMNSPGHRRNILGNYKEVGFGRAGNYWTTNFATPGFGEELSLPEGIAEEIS